MLPQPMLDETGTERRWFSGEVRVTRAADDKPIIEGYAALYNVWSENLGYFREIIRPGTFDETVEIDDIRGLGNHRREQLLGRNKSGTLDLAVDETGLYYKITPGNQSYARDLIESIERGDCDQSSFGFHTLSDRWGVEDEEHFRELLKVQLFDVAPVTFAAYPQTSVVVRDLFGGEGLCWNGICDAMVKSSRGIPLHEQEVDILNQSVRVLDGMIPREGPEDEFRQMVALAVKINSRSGEQMNQEQKEILSTITRSLKPFISPDLQEPDSEEREQEKITHERDSLLRRVDVEEKAVI